MVNLNSIRNVNMNRNSKIQVQLLYYIAVIVIVSKLILAYSELFVLSDTVNSILNFSFIGLMLIKLLSSVELKIKKIYIAFTIFALIAFYTSIQIDNYIILFSTLGIIALKQMNVRSIIKLSFFVKVFWLSIHLLCFIFAMIFNPEIIQHSLIDGVVRYRIFLTQPNTACMLFLWTIFEFMYLYYDRLNFSKMVFCTILFSAIVFITKSKTSLIAYIFAWILIFFRKKDFLRKSITFFSKFGYIILTAIFVTMTIIYTKSPIAKLLNTFFTGRLAGAAKAYDLYGFTFFGQYIKLGTKIAWDAVYGVTSIWLENAYSMMFINYGIFYAIIIAVALWIASDYLTTKDKLFVCVMLVYGMSESYIVDIYLCFPLLLVANAIYDKEKYIKANYVVFNKNLRKKYGFNIGHSTSL